MTDPKTATVATYAASSGAVLFGLTANELAALVGAVVAILTFFMNAWFQWDRRRRELRAPRRRAADIAKEAAE